MSYPKEKAPFPHPGLPISQLELRPLSGGAPSREFIYHPIPMPKGFVQKEPLNMTPLKDQIRETDR